MLRVLHFFKTYKTDTIGGVEQLIWELSKGVSKFGIESTVLSVAGDSSVVRYDGHDVHRAKRLFEIASTPFSWEAYRKFKVLAERADVVHFHYPWPFMDLVALLSGFKGPSVVTYHSDVVRQKKLDYVYRPIRDRFLKRVTRIVATSPNYAASSPVLKSLRDKTEIIPIGLDFDAYPRPEPLAPERLATKLPERFLLFVGVLRYYKGLHILLESLRGADYPVVIAGGGPLDADLKRQAASLGLKNVIFTGPVSDAEKVFLLQNCYGFVFPSHLRSEAFGISLLEAAMYGKPMISCEIGSGMSYINQANQTGFVVEGDNPAAFRAALDALWSDPERAAEMGRQARARYCELFTAEKMISSYAALYKKVTSRA